MPDRELDLRFHGKLNSEINQLFNEISYEHRDKFNDLVTIISEPFKNSLDWWTQSPASRNTLASPFFHFYCCLVLILELIRSGRFNFNKVLVDSFALKSIIKSMLSDHDFHQCKVLVRIGMHQRLNRALQGNLFLIIFILEKIFQFFIARITKNKKSNLPLVQPIVLIDTFMSPGHVVNDRWYGKLWNFLTFEMKKDTYFVPTIVSTPFWKLYSLYKELRSSPRKFLIKEDFLNLKDLTFAFQYRRRIRQLKIEPVNVLGYDLSLLIREEFMNNSDVKTILESLLTYRFISNLSNQSIKVRLAIDWFEGQSIDKAWNLAFHKYYPSVLRIGYRAYWSLPFYLCSYPIPIEKEVGVLPGKITVQGAGMIDEIREFLPDLEVLLIPSFRTEYVTKFDFNSNFLNPNDKFIILVSLPISIHASLRVLKSLLKIQKEVCPDRIIVNYLIKCHPACPINKEFRSTIKNLTPEFMIVNEKPFPELLQICNLLITEGSSTCVEALAFGVPVIIMQDECGLYINPVPKNISKSLYKFAKTSLELIEAINFYVNLSNEDILIQKMQGNLIVDDYFQPITMEGIERLMNVN